MALTERQMILGQYVAALLADGTVRKNVTVDQVIRAVRSDLTMVIEMAVREAAARTMDRLTAIVRGQHGSR